MTKVEQVAKQIKDQGPEAVSFAKGYMDALSESGKRDKRYNADKGYQRGYLAGVLNSDLVCAED